MSKFDHIWNKLGFGVPGKKAQKEKLQRPPKKVKPLDPLEAIKRARKYVDEFNLHASDKHKLVLGFVHDNEMAQPFYELDHPILRAMMSTGKVLHYTAAGILAYELDKTLHSKYKTPRSALPDELLDGLTFEEYEE